jgi:hypothetical protein
LPTIGHAPLAGEQRRGTGTRLVRALTHTGPQVFGCTIEIAHDGVEAVSKMGSGAYDLVLMVKCTGFAGPCPA